MARLSGPLDSYLRSSDHDRAKKDTEKRAAVLEKLSDVPKGIVGVRPSVNSPVMTTRRCSNRCLMVRGTRVAGFGSSTRSVRRFEGFTPGAAWEDVKLGLRSLRSFAGYAIHKRSRLDPGIHADRRSSPAVPGSGVLESRSRKGNRVARLAPQEGGVAHRLLAEKGVIVAGVASDRVLKARSCWGSGPACFYCAGS